MAIIDIHTYLQRARARSTSTPLSPNDLRNLRRLIWAISTPARHDQAWLQAVWSALRRATGCPAPFSFTVEDIPQLDAELRRIVALTRTFHDAICDAEQQMVKRVLRAGAPADPVFAMVRNKLAEAIKASEAELKKAERAWLESDFRAFSQREEAMCFAAYDDCHEPLPEGPAR